MKLLIFLFVYAVLSEAQEDKDAFVQEQNQVVNFDGSYSYAYKTSNGINAEENGVGGVIAKGSYSYLSADGEPIGLEYIADENGFQPSGSILPQPPPVPDYIIRALEYIKNNPPPTYKR